MMGNKSAPRTVSVIIVTYNDAMKLLDCLACLREQTYPAQKTEIIVVDDGSSDGTAEAVGARFPEVRLIVGQHAGADEARNQGIREAKGEIIALVDSDCTVPTEWLESIVNCIQENDGAVVGGRILHRGGLWARLIGASDFGGFQGRVRKHVPMIPSCSLGAERSLLVNLGFDPRLTYEGDVLLSHYLRKAGIALVFDPRIVVFHHPSATAASYFQRGRRYAEGFVRTRLLEPSLPYGRYVKWGVPAVACLALGRTLLDWSRLCADRANAGIRTYEVPLALLLLFLKRLYSVPWAVREYLRLRG